MQRQALFLQRLRFAAVVHQLICCASQLELDECIQMLSRCVQEPGQVTDGLVAMAPDWRAEPCAQPRAAKSKTDQSFLLVCLLGGAAGEPWSRGCLTRGC